MELALLNMFDKAPILIAFLAGILTFISPCILPLLPPYMSYISGIAIHDIKNEKFRFLIFYKVLLFVFGFSLVFILFGISLNSFLASAFANPISNYVSAFIIIVFGVHFIGIFKLKKLESLQARVNIDALLDSRFIKKLSFLTPFILGLGFALGWSPCVGPILSSIMLLSASNINHGLYLMIFYALGLSMPFLITALLIDRIFIFFNKIKKHYRKIEICNGVLLIIIGLIIGFGGLDKLNAILQ